MHRAWASLPTPFHRRARVHRVCLEAVQHGDTTQQGAALGTLGLLMLEVAPEDVAFLVTLLNQSRTVDEAALLRCARELLLSPSPQLQWAAMKLCHGLCCFPAAAFHLCRASELQAAVVAAGLKPLLRADARLEEALEAPAWGPDAARSRPPPKALPGSKPFPGDWREDAELHADMLHATLTVLGEA